MTRAIVLTHVPFEGPARIAPLLSSRGVSLDVRKLFDGDPVPDHLAPDELLIVMGGPMGVADVGSTNFPFLARERELLARCLEDDAPVLGVCLGAQLLASAAGAEVHPMLDEQGERRFEVGWGTVSFHREGPSDPLLVGIPDEATVLHWHGDALALPHGARRLASTELCPNQAFQLGSRLFGLQFHAEVDAADVATFLREDAAFVERANGAGGVQRIARDTELAIGTYQPIGDRLLGNLIEAMLRR